MQRYVIGPVAMAFVAVLAVSGSVPAYAVVADASSAPGQTSSISRPVQSLQVGSAAPLTVQRDGYTSAAAPKPEPKPVAHVQAAATNVAAVTGDGWTLPVSGRLSSPFGERPNAPVAGVKPFHSGADIAAPCGQPVQSAQAGTVVESGFQGSYGNWVLIDHGNGIQTGYAHNSELLVSTGEQVAAGATIALVGSTGASSGCHAHFEVRVGGAPVAPVPFMSSRGISLG
ncbi:M23 family metallopeptidase [Cryobacterium gelidum]|nr:M23 family metallopeptidase [Cryobacterium gelidum]